MSLTIPEHLMARIKLELASLPPIYGKVMLQLTFNSGNGKDVGSLKILKSTEEELRP